MSLRTLLRLLSTTMVLAAILPPAAWAVDSAVDSVGGAAASDTASPDTIYRWRDNAGRLHFSNVSDRVPQAAVPAQLPPLATISGGSRSRRVSSLRDGVISPAHPRRGPDECPPADPGGVIDAVASQLAPGGHLDRLTLVVAGIPVATGRDAIVNQVVPPTSEDDPAAVMEPAAIAYPAGDPCPTYPPLSRYRVGTRRAADDVSLCDDYRRAFAQVGVAVSRDQQIGRSFRGIAEHFARVGAQGERRAHTSPDNAVIVPGLVPVALPAWTVDAHVAQANELAVETDDFVDELTVALEEIDQAARARGCWD